MKKRLLALTMALVLLLSMMPVRASAAGTSLAEMRARAEAIVNYTWTPTQNISTWNRNSYNGRDYFAKGESVKGVPYTLFTSEVVSWSLCSLSQYKEVASSNYSTTKYCASVGATRTGPVYGSCCADLVCEVFGGDFMNGSSPRYHNVPAVQESTYATTQYNVKATNIVAGDALSDTNKLHIIWVGEVTDSYFVIYEQTPPVARKVTISKDSINSSGYLVYGGLVYSTVTKSKSFVGKTEEIKDKPIVSTANTSYCEGDSIKISWNAVSGNEYYWINVYRNDALIVNQSMETSTSYTLENAQPGKYVIYVSANNSAGNFCSEPCEFSVADIQPQILAWVSDNKMGEAVEDAILGNWYYYCYKITDAVSGKLLDSIQENSYTVTMTSYRPDGSISHTVSYNNDNNWISIKATEPGTYKCKLEISGAFSFSKEFGFTVADPCESGHSWDGGKITTVATEKEEGVKTYTCTVCGETKTESIPKLGHSYTEKVTAPTCTEQGYTTYTCACGDSYKDTYVDALGHDMDGWEVAGAATCTEYGKEYSHCSRCDHFESRAVEPLGHDWKDWETKVEATCTEDGKESRRCTRCTTTEFDVISKLGHSWDEGTVTKAPEEGVEGEKTYTCTRIGCEETKTETIPPLDHTHKYSETVTAPSCTEKGYTTHTCTCGDSYKDTYVDALGHDMGDWEIEHEATCVQLGTECRRCLRGDYVDSRPIEPLGHEWNEGDVTKDPTETAEGERTYTCTRSGCGETKTETIPPLDHTHKYSETVTAPSCTEKGYTTHTCPCGDSYVDGETDALGHSWDDGKITKEPTEEASGEKTFTCTTCKDTKTEGIPPLEHTHEYSDTVTAPTCTEQGYTTHTCTCGDSYVDSETDALGHSWDNGKCSTCGIADPDWSEPDKEDQVIRLAGDSRFDTALAVADQLKEELGVDGFDAVIVASGTNFADALSGSYLAAVKNAPILLSCNDDFNPKYVEKYNGMVVEYVRDNLRTGGTVYILGGPKAVTTSLDEALSGYNVKRLAGANRYETNIRILEEAGVDGKDVLICNGEGFADSLSASATELPILLVNSKYGVFDVQRSFLDGVSEDFYVIGGESAVSVAVEEDIRGYGNVTRIGGKDRFETSVLIAEEFFEEPEAAVLAYAWNFPDGLCGGPLAAAMDAPLILTMTKREAAAAEYVQGMGIRNGAILGGTGLISDGTVNSIFG